MLEIGDDGCGKVDLGEEFALPTRLVPPRETRLRNNSKDHPASEKTLGKIFGRDLSQIAKNDREDQRRPQAVAAQPILRRAGRCCSGL